MLQYPLYLAVNERVDDLNSKIFYLNPIGLGCGPQETFRNCADVRIVGSTKFLPATDNPR